MKKGGHCAGSEACDVSTIKAFAPSPARLEDPGGAARNLPLVRTTTLGGLPPRMSD